MAPQAWNGRHGNGQADESTGFGSGATVASQDDESLREARARLEQAGDDPAEALALAADLLLLAERMAGKAEKLARIGDRTQARMVDLNRRLRQQEERYRGIFENSTEGIFLADAEGGLMAVNPALVSLLRPGEAADESSDAVPALAGDVKSLFHDPADYQAFARRLAANGQVRRMEARLATPRGPVWCLVGAALVEPDGHVVGMTQDISARKALEEELLRLAASDPLTGLANRRGFFEGAARMLGMARRCGTPLSMIMLDIDHFKAVNDAYGHDAGDAVLRAVAERLRQGLRVSDLAGRVGGEEFAVLCPGTDLAGGVELAERLRLALEDMVVTADCRAVKVTASFGVAQCQGDRDGAPSVCLTRADQALYAAKRGGRNRVCLESDAALGPEPPEVSLRA
jgi:diguanylate cyclase (GGDEF)-like protein